MDNMHDDRAFLASLSPAQRDYFIRREAGFAEQHQCTMRHLAAALSNVSARYNDSFVLALESQARP